MVVQTQGSGSRRRVWRDAAGGGGGCALRIFVLPVLQTFNVLTCSKMKVWKFAAIASMLLSSMLSILVCRDMFNGSRKYSPSPSSPSSPSRPSSSSSLPAGQRRYPRALEQHNSLISQCKLHAPRCDSVCGKPREVSSAGSGGRDLVFSLGLVKED